MNYSQYNNFFGGIQDENQSFQQSKRNGIPNKNSQAPFFQQQQQQQQQLGKQQIPTSKQSVQPQYQHFGNSTRPALQDLTNAKRTNPIGPVSNYVFGAKQVKTDQKQSKGNDFSVFSHPQPFSQPGANDRSRFVYKNGQFVSTTNINPVRI
jgi:hypothetical protein